MLLFKLLNAQTSDFTLQLHLMHNLKTFIIETTSTLLQDAYICRTLNKKKTCVRNLKQTKVGWESFIFVVSAGSKLF